MKASHNFMAFMLLCNFVEAFLGRGQEQQWANVAYRMGRCRMRLLRELAGVSRTSTAQQRPNSRGEVKQQRISFRAIRQSRPTSSQGGGSRPSSSQKRQRKKKKKRR